MEVGLREKGPVQGRMAGVEAVEARGETAAARGMGLQLCVGSSGNSVESEEVVVATEQVFGGFSMAVMVVVAGPVARCADDSGRARD